MLESLLVSGVIISGVIIFAEHLHRFDEVELLKGLGTAVTVFAVPTSRGRPDVIATAAAGLVRIIVTGLSAAVEAAFAAVSRAELVAVTAAVGAAAGSASLVVDLLAVLPAAATVAVPTIVALALALSETTALGDLDLHEGGFSLFRDMGNR